MGREDDDGGPAWGRAERELASMAELAHYVGVTRTGFERWRTGRPLRLTLIVSPSQRPEGELPQLVGVTAAHGSGGRHKSLSSEDRTVVLNVRITSTLKERARSLFGNVSELVRSLLEREVERREDARKKK